jgi:tyrosine-specific transport protein
MLEHDRTRLIGTILLLAGSCIGAGMLGLPVVTGLAGFLPAAVVFVIGALFMTVTALLLLEVNVWLGSHVSIVSMAGRTLGKIGQVAAWILFCYLFYLLLVAYSAGSGALVSDFWEDYTGEGLPVWVGGLGCTVIFGILVYFGTKAVDYVNRLFMIGLILTYLLLIGFGIPQIRAELLTFADWGVMWVGAPVVVISFGLHNMIPTVTRYLHTNMRQLRIAVVCGILIPLLGYLLFEWVILGLVPAGEIAVSAGRGDLVGQVLRGAVGEGWIVTVVQYFSFFAIVTSFLAQALSLVHFLADGFHAPNSRLARIGLVFLAVVPPFVASLYNPRIFIQALELAGAFGAVVLFGIMPALMVWVARYRERAVAERAIFGGRPLLVIVIAFSLFVMIVQGLHQAGVM